MEMVIDRENDPCSVRICVYMWMLVMCIMCILFVAVGLHARDMDFHVHTHIWEVIGYCAVHVLMYAILGCGLADHFFPWSVGKLGFLFQRSVRRHCFWNATWLLQASGHWVWGMALVVFWSVYICILCYMCVFFSGRAVFVCFSFGISLPFFPHHWGWLFASRAFSTGYIPGANVMT